MHKSFGFGVEELQTFEHEGKWMFRLFFQAVGEPLLVEPLLSVGHHVVILLNYLGGLRMNLEAIGVTRNGETVECEM